MRLAEFLSSGSALHALHRCRPKAPSRRRLVGTGVGLLAVLCAWLLLLRLDPPPDPYAIRPPGTRVLDRDGSLLRGYLSPDDKWRWRLSLDEIHPRLIEAVLYHEDRHFRSHPGVNPLAIVRAAWANLRNGHVVSGGSTLTMQLARLTDPRPRTLGAKVMQVYRAFQYECLYDKDRILEMYLNLAPYGGNVEGLGAAAQIWCGKAAVELSPAEAALLTVLPQSPTRRSPVLRPEQARTARDRLLRRLGADHVWDEETVAEALQRPLPGRRYDVPMYAPHFTDWMGVREPGRFTLNSTIDTVLQQDVEAVLSQYVIGLRQLGIDQASAVVLDAVTSELLAMAGSADYWDADHHGQVNGALGRRSPGSTLKPFVYALAYEHGLATPATLLEDVPIRYGSYAPENYDGRHRGVVSASGALRSSLNIPAVELTARLRRERGVSLLRLLQEAGAESLDQSDDYYGLSLVLGGGDVTLLELAALYGLLVRQGTALQLRTLRGTDGVGVDAPQRLLSKGACWLVLQDLTEVARPNLEALWRAGGSAVPVPWKTGTSYGHRDAWSVGIAGRYVVAVWTGNFDGHGVPALVGLKAAAPLLFELVETLPREDVGSWHAYPPELKQRRVCTLSGAPVGDHCPTSSPADYIPGVSPAATCRLHRTVTVDTTTGYAVCPRCRREGRWAPRPVTWWPPALAGYVSSRDGGLPLLPRHDPTCSAYATDDAPRIVQPADQTEYILRGGAPLADQAIPLKAWANAGNTDLWWFVDGTLLRRGGAAETVFWIPEAGRHVISVLDAQGRSASATVTCSQDGPIEGRTADSHPSSPAR